MIKAVVLSGGVGQRLWPISRQSMPKQFVKIFDDTSLFGTTINRLKNEIFDDVTVVTTHNQRHLVRQQLSELEQDANIVVEPDGKNTAASILAACHEIAQSSPDAVICAMPCDHYMTNTDAFIAAIRDGVAFAQAGSIVTFGVTPDRAATGYGYIELAENISVVDALQFHEKPDQETARKMLESGNFVWNMGIFLFRVDVMLELARRYALPLASQVQEAHKNSSLQYGLCHLNEEHWSKINPISIDHAIMEKIPNIKTVRFSEQWSDLGDWHAISEFFEIDDSNNSLSGNAHQLQCHNSTLYSQDPDLLLVGLGLKDIVAVATKDAVLVADAKHTQSVKEVVTYLEGQNREQAINHRVVHRPWGFYDSLQKSENYLVRTLHIKPKAKLTIQRHQHRNEHWVVAVGKATVTLNGKKKVLPENQSIIAEKGQMHQLMNNEDSDLVIIEVQLGDILDQHDIERYG